MAANPEVAVARQYSRDAAATLSATASQRSQDVAATRYSTMADHYAALEAAAATTGQ